MNTYEIVKQDNQVKIKITYPDNSVAYKSQKELGDTERKELNLHLLKSIKR